MEDHNPWRSFKKMPETNKAIRILFMGRERTAYWNTRSKTWNFFNRLPLEIDSIKSDGSVPKPKRIQSPVWRYEYEGEVV